MRLQNDSAIVVCIGNELVADDAAGYEVYRRLEPLPARLEYLGVGGFDLLAILQGEAHLIVVDAVQLGEVPGAVHVIPWQELPEAGPEISVHGVGLREIIEIGRLLFPEKMPERVTLVGIEGRCFNRTREFMTGAVAGAIDHAVAEVRRLVQGGVHE